MMNVLINMQIFMEKLFYNPLMTSEYIFHLIEFLTLRSNTQPFS